MAVTGFFLHGAAALALADMVVIGNPANANRLDKEQVSKIFLGKTREFPDGKPAKPVDQAEGRQAREEFLSKILHKTEPALESYWSTIVFTGNGSPPDALADDDAVKKFVAENPKAVGYIDRKAVDSSVKILFSED